ncbi:50S ribosomal protein L31 [Pseudomonas batumici]|uniref:Large ribosomal subunit protein bL31 n=1 Tax=Pseudomonas batumici TaxID=226910 RepID=A0A0C2I910_9PSED|nr:50S ribosomal protein L31 [Pseudomonas batumici]KIH85721.1 LSU ribosomal protein L31p, LSU ribosomal protein L31p, zinc-dependent [Pseudomonas batumici]
MKADIHPVYVDIDVTCSCGNKFVTRSTHAKALPIDVCNECHPFYTGKQKTLDTGGRVQKFADRFGMFGAVKKA